MPKMTDSKQDSGGNHNNLVTVIDSENVNITIHPSSAAPPPPLSNKFDLTRLPRTGSALFGRDDELALIDKAWQDKGINVLVLTAMGGAGKTALMQRWIDDERWRGAAAAYAYSFYSQGSSEDKQASAAEFFDSALAWFGHDGSVIRSEHDKGVRLAELVCRQRTLLLLDGLEPLQYPLGGAMNGALKDKGLISLCKQLAAKNNGLLLISSRQPVMELEGRPHLLPHKLKPLDAAAGIDLFRAAGIKGTDKELAATVEAYNGHALSLSLLAKYLSEYENGDIRQQDTLRGLTDFPEETAESRHAFKVMAAYERKLSGCPDLQILFCLGLFDRPVSAATMSFLRKDGVLDLPNDERVYRAACGRLRKQGLLNTVRPEQPQNLDTHPLVRQYFGKRLAELHPESWRQAHVRLYEHFKVAAKPLPDTLEEMEPLFAAVRHGCAAGMHQQALEEVYWQRIKRRKEHYLTSKRGAFAADLAVVAHFFAEPWRTPAAGLTDSWKAGVLSWAAFRLRALGRLTEAAEPMQAGLEMRMQQKDWLQAATAVSNLSQLYLTSGDLAQAVAAGRQSVELADKSGDAFQRMDKRTTLADALHQAGELAEAQALFAEAEKMQQEWRPDYDRLYSLRGFKYCDLLLAGGAWQEVRGRAEQWLKWRTEGDSLLGHSLEYLTLGRAALQEAIAQADLPVISGLAPDLNCVQPPGGADEPISGAVEAISGAVEPISGMLQPIRRVVEPISGMVEAYRRAVEWLNQAVDGLREAGAEHHLPRGLLARAAWGRWAAHFAAAERDLQDCEDIARRGGMQLHLIDCHLEAARLALATGQPVLARTAAEHLAAAQKGIAKTGYNRRKAEAKNIEELLNAQHIMV
jgi:tetratricopeptide (TPR) repeat protein